MACSALLTGFHQLCSPPPEITLRRYCRSTALSPSSPALVFIYDSSLMDVADIQLTFSLFSSYSLYFIGFYCISFYSVRGIDETIDIFSARGKTAVNPARGSGEKNLSSSYREMTILRFLLHQCEEKERVTTIESTTLSLYARRETHRYGFSIATSMCLYVCVSECLCACVCVSLSVLLLLVLSRPVSLRPSLSSRGPMQRLERTDANEHTCPHRQQHNGRINAAAGEQHEVVNTQREALHRNPRGLRCACKGTRARTIGSATIATITGHPPLVPTTSRNSGAIETIFTAGRYQRPCQETNYYYYYYYY